MTVWNYRSGARSGHRYPANGGASLTRDGKTALFSVPTDGATVGNPCAILGKHITEALDPTRAPSRARTLADMSKEEREEMARLYTKKRGPP